MSSELYACGANRLIYKAQNFATGITVTAYFWNPSLVKSALQTFTEIELGLYYLDYNFTQVGTYGALFYENGVKKTMGTYRVTELAKPSDILVDTTQKVPADLASIPINSELNAQHGSGSWETGAGGAVGPGALSCTWTQKDDDENPMDNVQIWITTDEAGINVIAGTLLTNALGQATFMLDPGTYYVWRERAGYNFTNPQEWTVS